MNERAAKIAVDGGPRVTYTLGVVKKWLLHHRFVFFQGGSGDTM
jgi:hypothetical protein